MNAHRKTKGCFCVRGCCRFYCMDIAKYWSANSSSILKHTKVMSDYFVARGWIEKTNLCIHQQVEYFAQPVRKMSEFLFPIINSYTYQCSNVSQKVSRNLQCALYSSLIRVHAAASYDLVKIHAVVYALINGAALSAALCRLTQSPHYWFSNRMLLRVRELRA